MHANAVVMRTQSQMRIISNSLCVEIYIKLQQYIDNAINDENGAQTQGSV